MNPKETKKHEITKMNKSSHSDYGTRTAVVAESSTRPQMCPPQSAKYGPQEKATLQSIQKYSKNETKAPQDITANKTHKNYGPRR